MWLKIIMHVNHKTMEPFSNETQLHYYNNSIIILVKIHDV